MLSVIIKEKRSFALMLAKCQKVYLVKLNNKKNGNVNINALNILKINFDGYMVHLKRIFENN